MTNATHTTDQINAEYAWASLTEDSRVSRHSTYREIRDAEFEGDTCLMCGTTVWDVDVDGDGLNTCELVGLRMDGVMVHPDVLERMLSASEVQSHKDAAMEAFQGEIDAGEWGVVA